jgi:GNAT superfamily N-acetyltransferase
MVDEQADEVGRDDAARRALDAERPRAEPALETELRDGTHVLIRTVEPEDKDAFVEGFSHLSTRSRYLRFHTGIEELSDEQLAYLTEVDGTDHVAWVAIDLDDPERHGIGVARFVRVAGEPSVAEAAVTVLDSYQGRGLGTLLLHVLADAAVRRGVSTFRAYVLGENRPVLTMLESLGPTCTTLVDDVYEVNVALSGTDPAAPDSAAGRVLRAVTGKELPAMHTTAPPVWLAADESDGAAWHRLRAWLDQVRQRHTDR